MTVVILITGLIAVFLLYRISKLVSETVVTLTAIKNDGAALLNTLNSLKSSVESPTCSVAGLDGHVTSLKKAVVKATKEVIEAHREVKSELQELKSVLQADSKSSQEERVAHLRIAYFKDDAVAIKCLAAQQAFIDPVLVDAVRENRLEELNFFIEQCHNINSVKGGRGISLLMYAALHSTIHENAEMIRLLIHKGAKVELGVIETGETPLHSASYVGGIEAAKLLLSNGADINRKTDSGATPLMCAANRDDPSMVEMLVASGAGIKETDNEGRTALLIASRELNVKVVRYLLSIGGEVNGADKNGDTPLLTAAFGYLAKVDYLSEAKHKDFVARTLLETIQCLIDHGADKDIKNKRGNSIFDIAAFCNLPEQVKAVVGSRSDELR